MHGIVKALTMMTPANEQLQPDVVEVSLEGLVGDKHASFTRLADSETGYPTGTVIANERQISLIGEEELQAVAYALGIPEIKPAWVFSNIAVAGIPHLTLLPPGTRLRFAQEVVLVVSGETLPCTFAGGSVQDQYPDVEGLTTRFPKAALHKRGLLAQVERAGRIQVGDSLHVEFPKQPPYPHEETV